MTDTRACEYPKIPGIEIIDQIGRGGMGIVYRGTQSFLEREVAIKVLIAHSDTTHFTSQARFEREARLLAGLDHTNLVACYQAGTTDSGERYLVMEYVNGPNLRQWLKTNGRLPARESLQVVAALARALRHAHRSGVIHRDVKPENVLLQHTERRTSEAFPYIAKLADLGLARAINEDTAYEITTRGQLIGTPATMAPEQFDYDEPVDHRTDIYGLGCVFFQMLTGEVAYSSRSYSEMMVEKRKDVAPNPRSLNTELPDAVAALCQRMLSRDAAARPRSYDELIDDIESLLTSFADSAREDEPSSRSRRLASRLASVRDWVARHRAVSISGALAVVLAIGFAIDHGFDDAQPSDGTIAIDGPHRATEGERLHFSIANLPENASVEWLAHSEVELPSTSLQTSALQTCELQTWSAASPYTIELEARIETTTGNSISESIAIRVDARDDAPRCEIVEQPTKEVASNTPVEIVARAVDPDATEPTPTPNRFEWRRVDGALIALPKGVLETTEGKIAFKAPESSRPYELEFMVVAIDANGARSDPQVIHVAVARQEYGPQLETMTPRTVREGEAVQLRARASDRNHDPLQWKWRQLSGPGITLEDADSEAPRFTAPSRLSRDTAFIVLEGTVRDPTGSDTKQVTYTIRADERYRQLGQDELQSLIDGTTDPANSTRLTAAKGERSAIEKPLSRGAWILSGSFRTSPSVPEQRYGLVIDFGARTSEISIERGSQVERLHWDSVPAVDLARDAPVTIEVESVPVERSAAGGVALTVRIRSDAGDWQAIGSTTIEGTAAIGGELKRPIARWFVESRGNTAGSAMFEDWRLRGR